MKSSFSTTWKSSIQPRKQRKFRANAPLHIRQKLMGTHLSPELRKVYKTRSIPVKKEDTVKIQRGQHKGKTGKVHSVSLKKLAAYIDGVGPSRKDGTKALVPIKVSNLMITELNNEDKKRLKRIQHGKKSS